MLPHYAIVTGEESATNAPFRVCRTGRQREKEKMNLRKVITAAKSKGVFAIYSKENCSWREGVCIVVVDPEPSSRFLRQRNVVVARFARPLRGLLGHTDTVVSHDTVDQNSWM